MAEETVTKIYEISVQAGDALKRLQELKQESDLLAGAQKEVAQTTGKSSQEYIALGQQIKANSAESRKYEKVIQTSINLQKAQTNSLAALKAQLSLDTAELDKYGDELENVARKAELTTRIAETTAALSNQEQAVGNFRRNVGNYASGFNTLNFQVQQVARELPSLAVNLQQFFLAISNNLPMLVDEVTRASAANEALRANNEKAIPVWKQLISSILSWQTALVVGITLITAYGKKIAEFFSSLSSGEKTVSNTTQALKDMNAAIDTKSLGKSIADFKVLAQRYAEVGNSAAAKNQFLKDYKTEIEGTGLAIADVNDADELFIRQSDLFIQALRLRAQAQAGVTLATEQYTKAIEAEIANADDLSKAQERLNFLQNQSVGYTEKLLTASDDGLGYIMASRDELIKNTQTFIGTLRKDAEAYKAAGDLYINSSVAVGNSLTELYKTMGLITTGGDGSSSGGGNTISESIKEQADNMLELEHELQRALLAARESSYTDDLVGRQAYEEEVFNLQERQVQETLQLQRDTNQITEEEYQKHLDILAAKREAFNNKQAAAVTSAGEAELARLFSMVEKGFEEEIAKVENEYEAGISRLLEIQEDASGKDLDLVFKTAQAIIQLEAQKNATLASMRDKKIADDKAAEDKVLQDAEERKEQAKLKREEEYQEIADEIQEYGRIASDIVTGITDLVNQSSEAQKQRVISQYRDEEQALADKYALGLYTEAEYTANSIALERKRDKELAKIERAQAQRNKAARIFQAIIDTASAIAEALPNIPLSIAVGALGAVQVGIIAAEPLPKAARGAYVQGRTHAQGGERWELERGEAVINSRSSSMFLPLLSAINQAGGGVPFTAFGADGGYALRAGTSSRSGMTRADMESAIEESFGRVRVVVAVEDIRRGEDNYAMVESRGTII